MTVDTAKGERGPRVVGRYALHETIASGGMATVHLGRLLGPVGFSRTVAIKRLHPQFSQDPEFVAMFFDEGRLAARIRHPNVVPSLDIVATRGELFLVMEYVHGESLSRLMRAAHGKGERIPIGIVSSIVTGILHGLHAAHEAKSEHGEALSIVHRDVSPQNVLMGVDGVARVLDFGVAKAAGRLQETRAGHIKGKLAYMSPEQLLGEEATRQADIYAAGVVAWELLTGERLFAASSEGAVVNKVLEARIAPPSTIVSKSYERSVSAWALETMRALDPIVLRALHSDPAQRFATAREMALAIEGCAPPAAASEVGSWVESLARTMLDRRADLIADVESNSSIPAAPDVLMSSLRAPSPSVPPAEGVGDSRTVDLRSLAPSAITSTTLVAPRRPVVPLAGLGIALVLGAVATTGMLKSRTRAAHSMEAEPAVAAAPSPETTFGSGAPAPAPAAATRDESPAVPGALANESRATPPPLKKPRAKPPASKRPIDSDPKADCWTIDATGIKRLNTRDPKCML